jgi:flavin reductase (DIM6/NTAB) family NADH-FMN oxidoreductase RutF
MFYRTSDGSGLPRDPWMMCVMPRPIGWISTISSKGGLNLAPYSFFNAIAEHPPMVMFATNGRHEHGEKDTASNIRATGQFVCNMATVDFLKAVRTSGNPFSPEVSEFDLADLETEPSIVVKPPRVKGSPIHLECEFVTAIHLPTGTNGETNLVTVGRVLGIHIDDRVIKDGLVDVASVRPLGRLGYGQFTAVSDAILSTRDGVEGHSTESASLVSGSVGNNKIGD